MIRMLTAFFVALATLTSLARSGEINTVLSIGDSAPAWEKLPGTDDKEHSFADFKDKEVLVVVFTCNSCPYAVQYQDRIIALAKKYAGPDGKVGLAAINVNTIAEDQLPQMKKRAKDKEFNFPYIYDASQKSARQYGATTTPEFFVLDKARKVVYMGLLDDETDPEKVKVNYVALAIEAALKGQKPEIKETRALGCKIRFAREKR